jgi:hypothetical protein
MQNVSPFPKKFSVINQQEQNEKPNLPQPFSYIKMTLAVVIGNGIVLAGLFGMFLLYLSTVTPFVD